MLDDFALTARIGEDSLQALGVPGVTAERFRDAFTRPFAAFYSGLLGRPVSEAEFDYIRGRYEREYAAAVRSLALQPDAGAALDLVAGRAGQSLLSMAPHDHLQEMVDHFRLHDRFMRVDGSRTGSSDGVKAASLSRHLDQLGVAGAETVLIGDTVDDFDAAAACGAAAVLVTTGSQSRPDLVATGAPVTDTLLRAASLALNGDGATPPSEGP